MERERNSGSECWGCNEILCSCDLLSMTFPGSSNRITSEKLELYKKQQEETMVTATTERIWVWESGKKIAGTRCWGCNEIFCKRSCGYWCDSSRSSPACNPIICDYPWQQLADLREVNEKLELYRKQQEGTTTTKWERLGLLFLFPFSMSGVPSCSFSTVL